MRRPRTDQVALRALKDAARVVVRECTVAERGLLASRDQRTVARLLDGLDASVRTEVLDMCDDIARRGKA